MKKSEINRRSFLRSTTIAAGAAILPSVLTSCNPSNSGTPNKEPANLMDMKNPVAIAMWDYTWLLRHHKYGEFENWDKVLDGLVDRGYNAIRIDCFPHLIAADSSGSIQNEYVHVRETYKTALWGNQVTMRSNPREGLIEFLKKCKARGIYIGLSTWFLAHGTERNLDTKSVVDFVRVWDETLQFIKDNDLMQDVIYIDLLNEYPLWHGLEWFKREMNERGDEQLFMENNPDANVPDDVFLKKKNSRYTKMQSDFFQGFIDESIQKLKVKWKEVPIFASIPGASNINIVDYSNFGAIDRHYWFSHHNDFSQKTGVGGLHMFKSEKQNHFESNYKKVKQYWNENKQELSDWMEGRIEETAIIGKKFNVPVGITEGWGAIFWQDHPLLDWNFIKESADVSVDLAIKHGYRFICTSNFTQPQFKGLWADVEWHQQITKKIKEKIVN